MYLPISSQIAGVKGDGDIPLLDDGDTDINEDGIGDGAEEDIAKGVEKVVAPTLPSKEEQVLVRSKKLKVYIEFCALGSTRQEVRTTTLERVVVPEQSTLEGFVDMQILESGILGHDT